MTQPVILIDLDGPLADFDRHYWATAIGLYDEHPFDIVDLNERRYRFLSDHLTTSGKRTQMRVGQVNKAGWFADLPPVPGAVDAVLDHFDPAAALCADPIRPDPAAGWGHVVVDRDAQPHRFESADAAIRSLAPQAPADGLEPAL